MRCDAMDNSDVGGIARRVAQACFCTRTATPTPVRADVTNTCALAALAYCCTVSSDTSRRSRCMLPGAVGTALLCCIRAMPLRPAAAAHPKVSRPLRISTACVSFRQAQRSSLGGQLACVRTVRLGVLRHRCLRKVREKFRFGLCDVQSAVRLMLSELLHLLCHEDPRRTPVELVRPLYQDRVCVTMVFD